MHSKTLYYSGQFTYQNIQSDRAEGGCSWFRDAQVLTHQALEVFHFMVRNIRIFSMMCCNSGWMGCRSISSVKLFEIGIQIRMTKRLNY